MKICILLFPLSILIGLFLCFKSLLKQHFFWLHCKSYGILVSQGLKPSPGSESVKS